MDLVGITKFALFTRLEVAFQVDDPSDGAWTLPPVTTGSWVMRQPLKLEECPTTMRLEGGRRTAIIEAGDQEETGGGGVNLNGRRRHSKGADLEGRSNADK